MKIVYKTFKSTVFFNNFIYYIYIELNKSIILSRENSQKQFLWNGHPERMQSVHITSTSST